MFSWCSWFLESYFFLGLNGLKRVSFLLRSFFNKFPPLIKLQKSPKIFLKIRQFLSVRIWKCAVVDASAAFWPYWISYMGNVYTNYKVFYNPFSVICKFSFQGQQPCCASLYYIYNIHRITTILIRFSLSFKRHSLNKRPHFLDVHHLYVSSFIPFTDSLTHWLTNSLSGCHNMRIL